MIYALSDPHGHYGKYRQVLQVIDLRPQDTLYVLGDAVDRGPDGVKILQDMMIRPNVVPILGDHEFMMAYCLRFLLREITDCGCAFGGPLSVWTTKSFFASEKGGLYDLRHQRYPRLFVRFPTGAVPHRFDRR